MLFVDIENLCGGSEQVAERYRDVQGEIATLLDNGPVAPTVIGHGPLVAWQAPNLRFDWPARFVTGHGIDGADLALVDAMLNEPMAQRSAEVVIASGDGIFTECALRLKERGIRVIVVSRPEALAARLAAVADETMMLESLAVEQAVA